jgi:hypothetical protein
MRNRSYGFAGVLVVLSAVPAWAHHSFAMFDGSKKMTLNGTVKEFQWIYPHAWIVMMIPEQGGQAKQWAVELESPAGLARKGLRPKTLTPGMKLAVDIHPLKDGSPGGSATGLEMTLPDGKIFHF